MPIKFECPSCHKKLSVSEAMAGKKGKCPGCQNALEVPLASTDTGSTMSAPVPPGLNLPRPTGPRPAALPTPARSATNGSSKRAQPASPPEKPKGPASAGPPALPPKEIDAEAEAAAALADEPPPDGSTDIEFECDFCSHPIKLTPDQAGKRVPCPECRRIVKVPEPKKAQKDWRQSENQFPPGARLANQPIPDKAWTATANTRASREALEEAGALPSYREPLTLVQRITRIAGVLVLVGLLGWGGLTTYRWWLGRGETAALQASLKFASDKEVRPDQAAALHLAAVDYFRASDITEANKQFGLGYGLLADDKKVNPERDLLLIDLALIPFDLAGTKEQVDEGRRISWEDAQKQTIAALKAIQSPEARLEGLSQVVRRLKSLQEVRRAIPIASRIFEVPAEQAEALSQVCLQLTTLGETGEATKAGTQALQFFEAKEPPKITSSILAVAQVVKKPPPKFDPKDIPDDTLQLAKCEGLARSGDLDGARKEAIRLGVPTVTLQALLAVASAAGEGKNQNDLEAALKLAESSRIKGKANASWLLFRLVDLGRQANVDEERLAALAQGIADVPLRGRAQLALLQAKLAKLTTVAPDTLLDFVSPNSLSSLRGRLLLARHNTRRDSGWPKTLQSWEPAPKAFGQLGQALGMHGEGL